MASDPATLLVIGATGGTGQQLCLQALESGLHVRGLVRDSSKLPDSISSHSNFTAHQADLSQPDSLSTALENVTYVICVAGSPALWQAAGMTKVVETILQLMPEKGVKRFLYQAGAFCVTPGEKVPIPLKIMKMVMVPMLGIRAAVKDNENALGVLWGNKAVEWCAVRPGKIVAGDSKGTLKEGTKGGVTVVYKDLAALELQMVQSDSFNGKAIFPVYT